MQSTTDVISSPLHMYPIVFVYRTIFGVVLIAHGPSDCPFNLYTLLLWIICSNNQASKNSLVWWIICENWSVQLFFFSKCCRSCVMGLRNRHRPPQQFKWVGPLLPLHPSSSSHYWRPSYLICTPVVATPFVELICAMTRIDSDAADCGPVRGTTTSGKKKALLIVVEDNGVEGFPRLPHAQHDARNLQRLLIGIVSI